MHLIKDLQTIHKDMRQWRHDLHQHAQTAYEEFYAHDYVKEKLLSWGIEPLTVLANTGIVATIQGRKDTKNKSIGLRADMDALNINEKTGLPYASCFDGKMHACGHDGHTAILLGAAHYLQKTKNFDGKVHLIFQPAEEGGAGANKMIDEGLFKQFPCQAVFGLHNWPWIEMGKIAMRVGAIMAAVDKFNVTITGREGHAAVPQSFKDPIVAAAQMVIALQNLVAREVNPLESVVLSVTNFNAGTGAFNIIPREAKFEGTIRALSKDAQMFIKKRFHDIIQGLALAYDVQFNIQYSEESTATINTENETNFAAEVAKEVFGAENVDTNTIPYMTGEDFGAMLETVPGVYVYLGQGRKDNPKHHNSHPLHHANYDFNDDVLPYGASFMARLVECFCPLG